MRRSDLLDEEAQKRAAAVDDNEAVDNEIGIMGGTGSDPAATRALALRRLGIASETPAAPPPAPELPSLPGLTTPTRGGPGPALARPIPPAPPPEQPKDDAGSGFKIPDFNLGMTPDKYDRVSQALYSAFTRKPLDASFFTHPGEMDMKKEDLAQKKSHNDFLKEQLRLKYAQPQKGATDPADLDANSTNTRVYKAGIEGNPAFTAQVKQLKDSGTWAGASKAQLQAVFGGAKEMVPVAGKVYTEGAKTDRQSEGIDQRGDQARQTEVVKQGGRMSLQDKKALYDKSKTEFVQQHEDKRAVARLNQAEQHFQDSMDMKTDQQVLNVAQHIPKNAMAIYDTGAQLDKLIDKMGGEGNLDGVGLVEGSIPNPLYGEDVIAFRQSANSLINEYMHELYGGNLTEGEEKRGQAAIPLIKGGRSEAEILHGIKLLRDIATSKADQQFGAASPVVKERLRQYYASGKGAGMFGPPQHPLDESGQGVAQRPSNAPSNAPPIPTTAQVDEPSPDQIAAMGAPGAPPQTVKVKPKTAPLTPPGNDPPKAAAPDQPAGKTPSGKPFFRMQRNARTRAVRYLDKLGQVIEEVAGGN